MNRPADDRSDTRPYRPCVGLMLFNANGKVFVGARIDTPGDHWQMPQGGVDPGETPRQAAMRELAEEVGTTKAEIIAECSDTICYDLPHELSRRIWQGRYRGQSQHWFALRFTGEDSDVDIAACSEPEFRAWKWADIDELTSLIVPFKRDTYRQVIAAFRRFARRDDP